MTGRPLVVLGTRPEAIKLAPVVRRLQERGGEDSLSICVTGQHREMVDQILTTFDIKPHHDLDLMRPGQTLFDVTTRTLNGVRGVIEAETPSVVLVQGDTTTVFASALAAFYSGVPVGHVEAGLRTWDKRSPFPEEMNRVLASDLADLHFAPTTQARDNLLREGRRPDRMWVTGNTVVDALRSVATRVGPLSSPPDVHPEVAEKLHQLTHGDARVILVTGHRRESFGEPFARLLRALTTIANAHPDVRIVYPVHLNPNVRGPAMRTLSGVAGIELLEPLPYSAFVWLLAKCSFVLTDSGGIQEEAPALGKPVLVAREKTERPEAIEAGAARLVGTDDAHIVREVERLLNDKKAYDSMANAQNPFGDGNAARRIVEILEQEGFA